MLIMLISYIAGLCRQLKGTADPKGKVSRQVERAIVSSSLPGYRFVPTF